MTGRPKKTSSDIIKLALDDVQEQVLDLNLEHHRRLYILYSSNDKKLLCVRSRK